MVLANCKTMDSEEDIKEAARIFGRLSHSRHKERDEKGYKERQSQNSLNGWKNRKARKRNKVL
jgi:hypothetical protein